MEPNEEIQRELNNKIMEHLDAICQLCGVPTLSESMSALNASLPRQVASIEQETGKKLPDGTMDVIKNNMLGAVAQSVMVSISGFAEQFNKNITDPAKFKQAVDKLYKENDNGSGKES